MATTNFEGYSHEQLLAMIASLDPETVKTRATQLAEAAKALNEIGDSLKSHQVKGWEGEAAHALQEWVGRAGNATLTLSKYSEAGSTWMTHAAQTMVEVKANTPKYDKAAADNLEAARTYHNDPDAQQIGQTAHAKLTADHEQAVQQLTKLAQSYDASATQLGRVEAPTFPPPPGVFAPQGVEFEEISRPRGDGASAGSSGSGATPHAVVSPSGGGPSGDSGWAPSPTSSVSGQPSSVAPSLPSAPVLPARDVDVDLDHVATLPDKTLPLTPGLPVGPVPAVPGGIPPTAPVPPLTLPPVGGPPLTGGGALPISRGPVGIGGKVGSIPVPSPRDTGIVGGRQIATGGPAASIPRGTVIGAEGPQVGGGRGMPNMMGGAHGAAGSQSAGRRLAMEPGGVVGGRQAAAGGQPFTQGGSGLVRNGSSVGTVGHSGPASPAAPRRPGGRDGNRPDYLTEEEETWQGDRRVMPPVID